MVSINAVQKGCTFGIVYGIYDKVIANFPDRILMKSMHHSSLNDWDHFKLISKFACKAGAVIASYRMKSDLVTANLLISIFIKLFHNTQKGMTFQINFRNNTIHLRRFIVAQKRGNLKIVIRISTACMHIL